ncbi:MAG: phosphonate monoester hydrolase, partial [Alphaproteobacteria bacterium]|nr:phosphonate monoester hydrolase [Alphaproteobacteria bacterium]
TWNNIPLRVGEPTLGDHLRPLGLRVALVGKTHMVADLDGMRRLGLDPSSATARLAAECGFEPYARDDGLHPRLSSSGRSPYNEYLRAQGYDSANPWEDFANSAEGPDGEILSGWQMRHARLPARVKAEHSETAWTTDQALAFLAEAGERPFCLHVSYIKPHWPYVAPAPYHALYGPNQVLAQLASEAERGEPHPVYAAFMAHEECQNWSRAEVRQTVIPAYMGLIAEIDHHVGRLVAALRAAGRERDTLIVFTSDHGDYLGDHWMGEKELFHEPSIRVPLIIVDPRAEADATRGTRCAALAEMIDLAPTFVAAAGGAAGAAALAHVLEGRSLQPWLHGQAQAADPWREAVVSELDYTLRHARRNLGLGPFEGRAWMLRTARWKLVFHERFRPQLYDLAADPQEFADLGADPAHGGILAEMSERLFAWFRARRHRITVPDAVLDARTGTGKQRGYFIGVW